MLFTWSYQCFGSLLPHYFFLKMLQQPEPFGNQTTMLLRNVSSSSFSNPSCLSMDLTLLAWAKSFSPKSLFSQPWNPPWYPLSSSHTHASASVIGCYLIRTKMSRVYTVRHVSIITLAGILLCSKGSSFVKPLGSNYVLICRHNRSCAFLKLIKQISSLSNDCQWIIWYDHVRFYYFHVWNSFHNKKICTHL